MPSASFSDPLAGSTDKTNAAEVIASVAQANKDIKNLFGTDVTFNKGNYADKAMFNAKYIPNFEKAIDYYEKGIQDVINDFNPDGKLNVSIKGQANTAIRGFLKAFKDLLTRYVQAIDVEKAEVELASKRWTEATTRISGNVQEHTSSLNTKASNVQTGSNIQLG